MLTFKTNVRKFLSSNSTILNFFFEFAARYPTPDSLTYSWNFGFIALVCLIFQILTGVLLTLHYIPDSTQAFESVEMIMREVSFGYFIRFAHANGASFFFFVVYVHIAKALFQSSYIYPRQLVWFSGVIIYVLMILIAFLGYVLPWGQMSFWAATVITSLLTVIPIYGEILTLFLLGDYSISHPTLVRFFGFHVVLPFILLFIVLFHLVFLHNFGSNSKVGAGKKTDTRSFLPLFFLKDFGFLNWIMIGFCVLVFFYPSLLGHPDNYMRANPLITPNLIVPEWYFLPFYAILKSVPSKAYGFLLLIVAIVILFFLPYLNRMNPKASEFQPYNELFCVFFILNFLALGFLGGQPYGPTIVYWSRWCTFFYFFYFIILLTWGSSIQLRIWNVGFFRWLFKTWAGVPRLSSYKFYVWYVLPNFGDFSECIFTQEIRSTSNYRPLSDKIKYPRIDPGYWCSLHSKTGICMCYDTLKFLFREERKRYLPLLPKYASMYELKFEKIIFNNFPFFMLPIKSEWYDEKVMASYNRFFRLNSTTLNKRAFRRFTQRRLWIFNTHWWRWWFLSITLPGMYTFWLMQSRYFWPAGVYTVAKRRWMEMNPLVKRRARIYENYFEKNAYFKFYGHFKYIFERNMFLKESLSYQWEESLDFVNQTVPVYNTFFWIYSDTDEAFSHSIFFNIKACFESRPYYDYVCDRWDFSYDANYYKV